MRSSLVPKLRSLLRADGDLRRTLEAELAAVPPLLVEVAPTLLRARLTRTSTLLARVLEHAERAPDSLALEMDDERLTYAELDRATSRIAHALTELGVRRGDVVVLLGQNAPRYVALVLGASRVGATAALVNHQLVGKPLAHALAASGARLALVQRSLVETARASMPGGLAIVDYGAPDARWDRLEAGAPAHPFAPANRGEDDDFVFIYTSGTTGFPKPCRVTHGKALGAGLAAGRVLLGLREGDKIYSPLPLYHASALLLGVGSALACGVPLALRREFSARAFFEDVRRYDATATLYIGEICRYLLATPPSPDDRRHRLRVAVGNGLRPEVWQAFQERFGIPEIREFYGATEAPGGIVNLGGVRGSVGHLPFSALGFVRLAKYDVDRDDYVRDARGFVVPAADDEPGELLIRLVDFMPIAGLRFRGYTDAEATRAKILTNVFRRGDRWFRSGDLLRRDAIGFYRFVDRIGDTYRCQGENVSTNEVADVLARTRGVDEITVVGINLPGREGQFGLAAIVASAGFDEPAFRAATTELPSYARPRFVRVMERLETTGTFKHQKTMLRREGVDPSAIRDPLYVLDAASGRYVALDPARYAAVLDASTRL